MAGTDKDVVLSNTIPLKMDITVFVCIQYEQKINSHKLRIHCSDWDADTIETIRL
jgi:hypothetical protein